MCFALHWPNRFRCFPPSFFFARNGAERRAAHLMFFVAFFRCFRFVHSINSDNNFISHFSELSSSYSLFSSHIVFFSVAPYFFFLNNNANYSSFFHFGAESTLQKKKTKYFNLLVYCVAPDCDYYYVYCMQSKLYSGWRFKLLLSFMCLIIIVTFARTAKYCKVPFAEKTLHCMPMQCVPYIFIVCHFRFLSALCNVKLS